MRNFGYRFDFLSDWHIGSGTGRSGSTDSMVLRDADGFPYVPAKTVTGILRDAAEGLAWSLDHGQRGPWAEFVEMLFGSQPSVLDDLARGPRPALLSLRPAQYSPAFKESARLRGPGSETVVRSSTAIDAATGTARQHSLRTVELARATSILTGVGTVDCNSDTEDAALAFLAAAASMVEEVGGGRRRGRGRCRLSITGVEANFDLLLAAPPIASDGRGTNTRYAIQQDEDESTGSWHRITVRLDTELPVIVPAGTDGNVLSSRDHPTGSTLLPMVVSLAERAGLPCGAMVGTGRLKVSDAAPTADGAEFFPSPLAWSREKSPTDPNAWVAFNTLSTTPDVVSKQVRSGWVSASDAASARFLTVRMTTRAHASISDDVQRPTENTGGLFTYTAIAPGQRFTFTVLVRCGGRLAETIAAALSGSAAIGTSRKDDYGLVQLTPDIAVPLSQPTSDVDVDAEVTLWCTSDAVILDELGRADASAEGLVSALESAASLTPGTFEIVSDKVRLRTDRRDGWHSRWSLPRPTLVVIAAGSTVTVRATKSVDGDALGLAAHLGIGQRTAEGFGRVVVDHPLTTGTKFRVFEVDSPGVQGSNAAETDITGDQDSRLLDIIEADYVAARLRTASTVETQRLAEAWGLSSLGRSQVSRIRALLSVGPATDDRAALAALRAWLGDSTKSRRVTDTARRALLSVLDDPSALTSQLLAGGRSSVALADRTTREALVLVLEAASRTRNRSGRQNGGGRV